MNARADFPRDEPPPDDEVSRLRVPPHSAEAEQSVLGGLLLDASSWDRVGDLLTESDFYKFEHRVIFGAIAALNGANRPADVVTVFERLQSTGKHNDAGGLSYLNALAQCVPSAANARRYAEIVRGRSVLRKLIAVSDEIATAAFNPNGRDAAEVLDMAGAAITGVLEARAPTDGDWEDMGQLVVKQLDAVQADFDQQDSPDRVIPTGLADLDDYLDGGMRGGDYILIGARPSMGKTALADTIANHVAMQLRLPVGKFSMEMQNSQNAQRALAWSGRVPMHALRKPERMSSDDWSRISSAVEVMRGVPLYSYDRGGLNINQVRARARALRRKHGLRLLVLDYLQLMSGTDQRAPRHMQLEEASRGIKTLAKELDIPIIVLAQVNRSVEKETDPMPRMSDLKDCGSLEQDADIIFFLHRQWVHKPNLADEWKTYAQGRLAKQRGGRTGDLNLHYEGQFTRFSTWPSDVPVPTSLTSTPKKSSNL
jgi:replicative DNA helicase